MKYLLFIFFFPILLSAQDSRKTLLIVPLLKKNVRIKGAALKCVKFNKVTRDSAANCIYEITIAELKNIFSQDSLHFINEYIAPSIMDTSYSLKLHDRFYVGLKDSSFHLSGSKLTSGGSYHNKYYSCNPSKQVSELLKRAITDSKCDYVLFINAFEIIKPNSTLSISCEVTDKNMQIIFGDKTESLKDVETEMFFDVMKYYIKQSEEEMLNKIKNYLKN